MHVALGWGGGNQNNKKNRSYYDSFLWQGQPIPYTLQTGGTNAVVFTMDATTGSFSSGWYRSFAGSTNGFAWVSSLDEVFAIDLSMVDGGQHVKQLFHFQKK